MALKYRPEIDGLRSFAVFPVILFHAGHPWFTGGFLGVDVFFVISGFLITSFIITKLQHGNFSFIDFYDRRARRILPALLAVIVTTTFLSYFFMLPNDLKSYGQSVIATIFSVNNILLYLTSGYWSFAAEFKPLYHTWSLGVEEQFYLITPVLFAIIYYLTRSAKAIAGLIALMLSASFIYSLHQSDVEFNFLIIFTRAWELLIGSIAAIITLKYGEKNNILFSVIGLLLICISYVSPYTFTSNQTIVNIPAVAGGAMIILYSSGSNNFVNKLLSTKPLVFLGLLSYSIYLWHQPIMAFIRLSSEYAPSYWALSLWGLLSIPIAYISWRYIERPMRSKEITPRLKFYTPVVVTSMALVIIGFFFHISYGLESQRQDFSYGGNPRAYVDRVFDLDKDNFSDLSKTNITVVGNSFARDLVNSMLEFEGYSKSSYEIVYKFKECEEARHDDTHLFKNSDYIIFAANWGQVKYDPDDVDELKNCYSKVKESIEGQAYVLGGKNFGWNNNFTLQYSYEEAIKLTTSPLSSVEKFNAHASDSIGEGFVDFLSQIKNKDGKVPLFTPSGDFITYDTNHLTPSGAKYMGDVLFTKTSLSKIFK